MEPEIRRSLAEMGLLDDVQIEGGQVTVHFHLTSPLCPSKFATNIGQEIRKRVESPIDAAQLRKIVEAELARA